MKKQEDRGFSLVEVLVAVSILALVVGPLLYSFATAARINSRARSSLEATAAAQNVMEQIKAGTWDGLGLTDHGDGTWTRETTENINGQVFQVKVKLDANGYKRNTDMESEQFNDLALSDIYRMDKTRDAFYIQEKDMDEKAAADFSEDNSAYARMSRSIVLYIKKDREQKPEVTIDISYLYNGKTAYKEKGTILFRNTSEEKKLHSIYLFFQPMYTSQSGIKETISIKNEAEVPAEIYLVKQENSRTTEGTEGIYKVQAEVTESSYHGKTEKGWVPLTRIRTNLTSTQEVLLYNGAAEKNVDGTIYTAEELVGRQSLPGQVKSERIYEVEVEVLDETGETKAVLTGTKDR